VGLSIKFGAQAAGEQAQDLFAGDLVAQARGGRGDLQPPRAQLSATARWGSVGVEPGTLHLVLDGLVGMDDRHGRTLSKLGK
jgi:hypothetical protein